MRKQFLNSSRNNTELTISSFLQSVIPSFIRTSGKRWVEHRCAINLAQIYSERAPTNHCVGFSCPSLAISENADIVPVKCRSEDWFYFLENILCMDHTEMNHTAEEKNWQSEWKITLCWLLIKNPINTELFFDSHWLDCNLLLFDSNRWFGLQIVRLDQWPYPAEDSNTSWILAKLCAQILGNSRNNNCYLELKTVPFRSMSLSSASRLLRSRCRCLDRRTEISSETTLDWDNSIRSRCKVTITLQATHSK